MVTGRAQPTRGIASAELDLELFGETTERLVRHFQIAESIHPSGDFDDTTAAALDAFLLQARRVIVWGRVCDEQGTPLTGAVLSLVSRSGSKNRVLARILSDSGRFVCRCTLDPQMADLVAAPSLSLEIQASGGAGEWLGEWRIKAGLSRCGVLALAQELKPAEPMLSAWTTLGLAAQSRFATHANGALVQALWELDEPALAQANTELTASGRDAEAYRHWFEAFHASRRHPLVTESSTHADLAAAAYFGWLRSGVSADPDRLAEEEPARLIQLLKKAATKRWVPPRLQKAHPLILEALALLPPPTPPATQPVADITTNDDRPPMAPSRLETPDRFVVEGRVVDERGRGLAGLPVMLFDEDVRGPRELGVPSVSSDDGRYRFSFGVGEYAEADVGMVVGTGAAVQVLSGPDLWVGQGPDALHIAARTEIVFNAGPHTVMADLIASRAALSAGVSDLKRVAGRVTPRLKGAELAQLTEGQVAFLARDCEESVLLVRALKLAAGASTEALRLAQSVDLGDANRLGAPGVLDLQFTLAAAGQCLQFEQVLSLHSEAIQSTLKQGVAERRIEVRNDESISAFAKWIEQLRAKAQQARRAPSPAGVVEDPAQLLTAVPVGDAALRDRLAANVASLARWMASPSLARRAASRNTLAKELALAPEQAAPLHTALRLNVLAAGHQALLQRLWADVADHRAAEPLASLAQLDELGWIEHAHAVAEQLPPGVDPSTLGRAAAGRAELLMPGLTLSHRLKASAEFQRLSHAETLATRLAEHPDLDLMDATPAALGERLGLSSPEVATLTGLRQFKLAHWPWQDACRALAAGITSLDDVMRLGKAGVERRLSKRGSGPVPDESAIARLHQVAGHVMAHAAGATSMLWPGSAPGIGLPPGLPGHTEEASEDAKLRELLQLDGCACDPCLSMLSSAAYRADLLSFIEASIDDEELIERRLGGVKDLLLSCDNDRIEKVQLDLTIERMENMVALPFEVTLADGETPAQQLAAPSLGHTLRQALRSTTDLADAQFGPFEVMRESLPSLASSALTTWLVADAARHWRVRSTGPRLGTAESANQLDATAELGPLLDDLPNVGNVGPLSAAALGSLRSVLRRAIGWLPLPLHVGEASATRVEGDPVAGRQWKLTVVATGQVKVTAGTATHPQAGKLCTLRLASLRGGSPAPRDLIRATDAAALKARFNADRTFPPDLAADLQGPGQGQGRRPLLEPMPGAPDTWRYTITAEVELSYRPGRFEVLSLTYQSTPDVDASDAEPVHRNARAYDLCLNRQDFPWTLPFDESLSHARALLRATGLERKALQEAAQGAEQWMASDAWAAEVLGLAPSAFEQLIAELPAGDLWKHWGLKRRGLRFSLFDGYAEQERVGTAEELLGWASVLQQQARLKFDELRLVLATAFVNPDSGASLDPADECDPTRIRLRINGAGSILELCGRLHRFVRLWRAVGWQAHELDAVLAPAFRAAASSSHRREALRLLALVKQLQQTLALPVDVLADWLTGTFNERAGQRLDGPGRLEPVLPPYARVFQNPAVSNPPEPLLRADQFTPPAAPRHPLPLRDLRPAIAAALGLRPSNLNDWLRAGIPDLADMAAARDQPGSLERDEGGLLTLWRHVGLAHALGLEVDDYAAATRLLGPSPFASGWPRGAWAPMLVKRATALLRWCQSAARAKALDLPWALLEQALRAPGSQVGPLRAGSSPFDPTAAEAAATLTALQQALRSAPVPASTPVEDLIFPEGRWPAPTAAMSDADRWRRWGLRPAEPPSLGWQAPNPQDASRPFVGAALDLLGRVDILARQLNVKPGVLRAQLQTRVVDPDRALTLVPGANPNDPWRVRGLSPSFLDGLEAFAVMQAATGFGTMLLDLALSALKAAGILEPGLQAAELAALRALRGQTGLDLPLLVAFWSGFTPERYDTFADDDLSVPISTTSLFEVVFPGDGRWVVDGNGRLTTVADDGSLVDLSPHWLALNPDALLALCRTLTVEPADLVAGVEGVPALKPPGLDGLKDLHQWLTLGRALRLTVPMQRVCRARFADEGGRAPFAKPSELLHFIDGVERLRPRTAIVVERLSGFAGIDPLLASHLLAAVLPSSAQADAATALQHFLGDEFVAAGTRFEAPTVETAKEYRLLRALRTFAWFTATWKLDRLTVRWLPSSYQSKGFGNFNLGALAWADPGTEAPWREWDAMTSLLGQCRNEPSLVPVLEAYRIQRIDPVDPADLAPAIAPLALAFAVDAGFATQLARRIDLSVATGENPERLTRYLVLLRTCRQLGLVDVDGLEALLDNPAPGAASAAAQAARRVVLARHGQEAADDVLREAARTVRHDRRDRLAEYLAWRDGLATPEDLLGHVLADPFESDSRRTTRELFACATLQLYLNRCVMGLERGVDPESFDAQRVQVVRSRTVRNAALEVFLFPYRYWRPEFNDDRSAALVSYENALNQNEATLPNVHVAIRRYMDELIELMNLKVISMHIAREGSGTLGPRRVLYQLGRTRSRPHAHYWRTCQHYQQAGMRWTGWQKIDTPIDGDSPVIFVQQGVPHVAWPMLREANKTGPLPRWNLQVACMRYLSGRWSPRKNSNDEEFDGVVGLDAGRTIYIDWSDSTGTPMLRVFKAGGLTAFVPRILNPEPAASDPSQIGPYWEGFNEKDFIFHPPEPKTFMVSVRVQVWIKYAWAGNTHFREAATNEVQVSLELDVIDGAGGKSWLQSDSQVGYDALFGRFVKRFSGDAFEPGNWITRVSITVRTGFGEIQSYRVTPAQGSRRVMDVSDKEHVFDVVAVFKRNEEPPEAQQARESMVVTPLRRVEVDFDGQPTVSSASADPPPALEGIPSFARAVGNSFAEVEPGAGPGDRVSANIYDKDTLAILGEVPAGPSGPRAKRFDLVRASHGRNEPDASIWWLDEGEAAALIDASAGDALATPRLLPSSPALANQWREQSRADVSGLVTDPGHSLEVERSIVPGWVAGYEPQSMPRSRSPVGVPLPAFDSRFILMRDFRELQLDVIWAAASIASQQQRHGVARDLLRLLYDPWSARGDRRWSYYPISEHRRLPTRHQLFAALCDPQGDPELKRQARLQIATSLEDPFNPYALMRLRSAELRTAIVDATARNESAQGDLQFLQFTNESVDRARIHYTSMLQIVGRRPETSGSRAKPQMPLSYRQLMARRAGASPISGSVGTWHLIDSTTVTSETPELNEPQRSAVEQVLSLTTGYFCVPSDDALLELWDIPADRLSKMRNGQNIQGLRMDLPVRDPRIDPLVLIRAARAGVGIDDALSDLYAPPSHLRFHARLALAQEVISTTLPLVAAAWAAQEEADNEHLTVLRAGHELAMLRLTTQIRADELREAEANIDALKQERKTLRDEIQFLNRQLGADRLAEDDNGIPVVDPTLRARADKVRSGDGRGAGLGLSTRENAQLDWMQQADLGAQRGSGFRMTAHASFAIAAALPATLPGVSGPVDNPAPRVFSAVGNGFNALAEYQSGLVGMASAMEKGEGMLAGFERRHDQIKQEMLSRVSCMKENGKRLAAAEIRKAIAGQVHQNHLRDVEHKQQDHDYIHSGRFATEATKRWAQRKAHELGQAGFRLAMEQALLAWQAMRHECGDPQMPPPDTRAWDGRYLGRFALESLQQSLLRMKVTYESRPPELEITAHVSLRQLDPKALVQLRHSGSCSFELTEFHLNRSMPSALYFQRIKTLSLSIPCVVGPYIGVHAKLSILSNQYRHSEKVLGGNLMAPENFRSSFLPRTELLTSGAQNDGGMFEVNLRGEQLLVGEGAGLGRIKLKLEMAPVARAAFDYETISDVVLHIRYTARSSPSLAAEFDRYHTASPAIPSSVLLSCRSDFSQAWYRAGLAGGSAEFDLSPSLLPYTLAKQNRGPKRIRWLDLPVAPNDNLEWRSDPDDDKIRWTGGPWQKVTILGTVGLKDRLLLLEFE